MVHAPVSPGTWRTEASVPPLGGGLVAMDAFTSQLECCHLPLPRMGLALLGRVPPSDVVLATMVGRATRHRRGSGFVPTATVTVTQMC